MMKLLNSMRVSMLLGKAHKYLENGRYREALEKALKAKTLKLEPQFEWLCYLIEGKSRYHLGERDQALPPMQQAQRLLAAKLETEKPSKPLQNILADVDAYIDKIKQDTG